MFFFQKNYFNEARGQHLKIFFYQLLIMILAIIAIMIIPSIVMSVGAGFSNAENFATGALGLIFGILIFFISVIFILMPLQYSIYAYYMYGYKRRNVKFSDGLFLFKNGNYWKSIGLIFLLLIMTLAITSVISGLIYGVSFGVLTLFGASSVLFDPETVETLSTPTIITFFIVQFLMMLLQILVSLLVTIAVAMIMLNHIDQPGNTLGNKFSKGLAIAFKSGKDLLKLFFSNALLNLAPFLIVLIFAIIAISVVGIDGGSKTSFGLTSLLVGIFVIGFIVSVAFVTYLQTGSFISYYFTGREQYENKYEVGHEQERAQHITIS